MDFGFQVESISPALDMWRDFGFRIQSISQAVPHWTCGETLDAEFNPSVKRGGAMRLVGANYGTRRISERFGARGFTMKYRYDLVKDNTHGSQFFFAGLV